MAKEAITKMQSFHNDIVGLYDKHDMDLLDNLGRRNIVMSQAQEKFFAQVLSDYYDNVHEDGRTGQPDIVIGGIDKELECKLTSRHRSGGISFQTDHQTLTQKGSLDYLYVIADETFSSFSVLHFVGLTVDDFRPISNGSRGKVAMYKHKGMKKCNILMGDVIDLNELNLEKLRKKSKTKKTAASIEYWNSTPTKYRFRLEEVSS
tara:strand:- start:148 stop:762 length:615 start_codon:yes stop_codon:yes gene_type:complete